MPKESKSTKKPWLSSGMGEHKTPRLPSCATAKKTKAKKAKEKKKQKEKKEKKQKKTAKTGKHDTADAGDPTKTDDVQCNNAAANPSHEEVDWGTDDDEAELDSTPNAATNLGECDSDNEDAPTTAPEGYGSVCEVAALPLRSNSLYPKVVRAPPTARSGVQVARAGGHSATWSYVASGTASAEAHAGRQTTTVKETRNSERPEHAACGGGPFTLCRFPLLCEAHTNSCLMPQRNLSPAAGGSMRFQFCTFYCSWCCFVQHGPLGNNALSLKMTGLLAIYKYEVATFRQGGWGEEQ